MTAGRPAKPTALKLLHGDAKKNPQRVNRSEPVPSGAVETPGYLSPSARAVWDEIAPDRIRQGVLTPWDVDAFASFCSGLAFLRLAAADPMVLELAKPGQESMMSKYRQLVAICSTLGGRFGWTPADRQKLAMGKASSEPGADLLSG